MITRPREQLPHEFFLSYFCIYFSHRVIFYFLPSVIEAAIGLQAWRILEDLNNHVDLVLTEVVMPCLSGIGLLYKIMSHKTRKNIPVISK